jgi:hypothetical protein
MALNILNCNEDDDSFSCCSKNSCNIWHCLLCFQVEVPYKDIKEIRTAPRAFGLWGDMVIFLKDGNRLEITGLDTYADIKRHIQSCIYD